MRGCRWDTIPIQLGASTLPCHNGVTSSGTDPEVVPDGGINSTEKYKKSRSFSDDFDNECHVIRGQEHCRREAGSLRFWLDSVDISACTRSNSGETRSDLSCAVDEK